MTKFKRNVLLPALLAYSANSHAFDWLLEPEFSSSERYDDNITMQVNSASMIDSMISTLSPGVLLGYQAENDELKTRFKWNELIYHDASALDFSEKLLTLSHKHQTEWFRTGLDAEYSEQSSINTQLDETGNGLLFSRLIPRTTRSVSPNVLFNISERNSLQLAYSYLDVAYQRPPELNALSYSDYTSQQLSATAFHSYSERLTLNLTGSYSIFESSGDHLQTLLVPSNPEGTQFKPYTANQHFTQNSKTFFYQAGMQYAVSELTQVSLSAGMRDTTNDSQQFYTIPDTDYVLHGPGFGPYTFSSTASGHVFSANLTHNEEWGNFSLNAGQQLNPSSSGQQQQTTSFSGQARYNFTERLSTGLNVSHLISESTSTFSNNTQSYNRTYTTISPNIQWRWTPEINLQLSYSHREQEYTARHETAIGNNIQLQFSYQPQINRQVK